ncbi:MAG TPA: YciI family protein [Rhodocyclaceae bacterium]|uniref:YciI family protein n=1 Tax=Thauera sp. TaxID=1905334 RepID=UPI002C515DC6|nr:YciI family protein [Thauera sp.]HRP23936.1 YciI family protein [Thauera sp.]HRQ48037.1 YciI family protein [Rhodocyclaceae bacterium]
MGNQYLDAAQIVALCGEKGFLARQLYLVHTRPVAGLDAVMDCLEEHLAYQVALERRGVLFAAGPIFSDDGQRWSGEGCVAIRAGSLDEAREIAALDPMHARGARRFIVQPWLVNEGSVTIRVNFSDGSGAFV